MKLCGSLVLCLLLLPSAGSRGVEVINVATYEYPPYMSEALPGGGVLLQRVCRVARRAGYQLQFHFLPFKRALIATRNGEFDAMVSLFRTDEREAYFDYSDPVGKVRMSLIAGSGRKLTQSMPVTIGVGRGYYFDASLVKHGWVVRQYDSDESVFNMLQKSRIDLAYSDPVVFEHISSSQNKEFRFYLVGGVSSSPAYDQHMVFPKERNVVFRRDFNRYLSSDLSNGLIGSSVCE